MKIDVKTGKASIVEVAPSGIKKEVAKKEGVFARVHDEVEKKQFCCELLSSGKLHQTPCNWEQYLEPEHRAED